MMKSVFKDPKKKKQLEASFSVVAEWAETVDPEKFSFDMGDMAEAADRLSNLCRGNDPARAMRYSPDLVNSMDDMISLQKSFKQLSKDDTDRTNPQLRTALRRIEKVRNDDVWHVQLT